MGHRLHKRVSGCSVNFGRVSSFRTIHVDSYYTWSIYPSASSGDRPTPFEIELSLESQVNLEEGKKMGVIRLGICIGGVYAAFLLWAIAQERCKSSLLGPRHI